MKVRWRFVLGVACCALVGLGRSMSTSPPSPAPPAVRGTLPPEVEELLPNAVPAVVKHIKETINDPMHVLGVGDVDGDNRTDIVIGYPNKIEVYQGQGEGQFVWRGVAGAYMWHYEPTGLMVRVGRFFPHASVLADLNYDQTLELVVAVKDLTANPGVFRLFVFPNLEGDFLEPTFSTVLEHQPRAIWASDYTGDGDVDLLVVAWTGVEKSMLVYLLAGLGGLAFTEPVQVAATEGTPFALTDVNGDRTRDLCLYTRKEVVVLFGDGRGGFAEERRFRVTDVDRVFDADLEEAAGGLTLALATDKGLVVARSADGWFGKPVIHGTEEVYTVVLGRFRDGQTLDAWVWGSGERCALFHGNGRGGFLQPGGEFIVPEPYSIYEADLDGDGIEELLLNDLYVLSSLKVGVRGEARIPFRGSALLAVGDLSGNGAPDLLGWGRGGLEVLWNNGKGGLVRANLWQGSVAPVAAQVFPGTVYLVVEDRVGGEVWALTARGELVARQRLDGKPAPALAATDLDGNGIPDVLALTSNYVHILWDGKEMRHYLWERGQLSLAWAGDLDGDGAKEVVLVSTAEYADLYVLSFAHREPRVRGPVAKLSVLPVAVSEGDVDGDGVINPVFACLAFVVEEDKLRLYIELAVLSSEGVRTWRTDLPAGEVPWVLTGLAVGDFSEDGVADAALSVVSGRGVFLLPGRGDGTFAPGEWLKLLLPTGTGPIFAADLDRNGQAELFGSTSGLGPHIFIIWNGGGQ